MIADLTATAIRALLRRLNDAMRAEEIEIHRCSADSGEYSAFGDFWIADLGAGKLKAHHLSIEDVIAMAERYECLKEPSREELPGKKPQRKEGIAVAPEARLSIRKRKDPGLQCLLLGYLAGQGDDLLAMIQGIRADTREATASLRDLKLLADKIEERVAGRGHLRMHEEKKKR